MHFKYLVKGHKIGKKKVIPRLRVAVFSCMTWQPGRNEFTQPRAQAHLFDHPCTGALFTNFELWLVVVEHR